MRSIILRLHDCSLARQAEQFSWETMPKLDVLGLRQFHLSVVKSPTEFNRPFRPTKENCPKDT
jgi:hypothetical protein